MAKPKTTSRPFQQTAMATGGGRRPATTSARGADHPVALMARTSVRRSGAAYDLTAAAEEARATFSSAVDQCTASGADPLRDASVIAASRALTKAAAEHKAAQRAYDDVWRGESLVDLPPAVREGVQAAVRELRHGPARPARPAPVQMGFKLNGARRRRRGARRR